MFSLSIRGIYSAITDIRRQVFTEIARMGYEGGDYSRIEDLPYKIVPGEVAEHRSSIFLERAIVGERLRLAMGLSPVRSTSTRRLPPVWRRARDRRNTMSRRW